MGSKKLQVWLPVLFSLVMIVGMSIGFQLKEKTMSPQFFSFSERTSLQELTTLIKRKYVDKLAIDSINELAATELLQHLDPHSVFIPAKELIAVNEELQGNFEGIGIEFRVIDDTVNVMNIVKDGPAEKAGVQIGDKLLSVADSIAVSGKNIDITTIRKLFRGPINSLVKVKYKRANLVASVTITRNIITISSIDAAYMVSPGIGYIRINKFADRTYEEFMKQLEMLQAKKMQSLVLDLRGNGGGLLDEAVDIADEFLDDNKLIVYTEGENAPKIEYSCKRPGIFETGKLVLLIDETSASASEVLAGALQDWDRATIIGRKSFGKGLVQQQFQLSDGSAVRLTVARYFTPLGRNIQKPYDKGIKAYNNELLARLDKVDTLSKKDSLSKARKAYKTKSGKIVFGGGGIMPDSIIAFDSSKYPKQFIQLMVTNTLANFSYHYFVEHKDEFKQFKNPNSLLEKYMPNNKEWTELLQFSKKQGIELEKLDATARNRTLITFKSFISRYLWRDGGYFIVINSIDPFLEKALSFLK